MSMATFWRALIHSTIATVFLLPVLAVGIFLIHNNRYVDFSPKDAKLARRTLYITVAIFWLVFLVKIAVFDQR